MDHQLFVCVWSLFEQVPDADRGVQGQRCLALDLPAKDKFMLSLLQLRLLNGRSRYQTSTSEPRAWRTHFYKTGDKQKKE